LSNRFLHFFLRLAITVLLIPFFAQAQSSVPQSDHAALARRATDMGTGKWWVKLSDEAKDKFIERYTDAMNHVASELLADCADGMKSLPRNDAKELDIMSDMILCKIGSSFDFNFDRKEIRDAVDLYYNDATNLTAPIDAALQHVREALEAKRPRPGVIG
jgi:hypothetical protein